MGDSQSLLNPENNPAKVQNVFINTAKFFFNFFCDVKFTASDLADSDVWRWRNFRL